MKISKEKVKIYLARNKMTMSDLAEKYGVTRARITKILSTNQVTPICAGRLAEALGVDVTELLVC